MLYAGVDIGSLSAKAVIINEREIVSWGLIRTGADSVATSVGVMDYALRKIGKVSLNEIKYIVATGYGRTIAPFANSRISEITCHAKGTNFIFPSVRTILDMGGQDCKVIRCDARGNVENFTLNDKCAAGTGRYLERVAKTLELSLNDIGSRSLETVVGAENINKYCTVFAQTDILLLLRRGKHINDILAGACEAIVGRIFYLLKRIGIIEDFSVSGGVAKNIGIVSRLEKELGLKAHVAAEPQLVGALGAAILAKQNMENRKKNGTTRHHKDRLRG